MYSILQKGSCARIYDVFRVYNAISSILQNLSHYSELSSWEKVQTAVTATFLLFKFSEITCTASGGAANKIFIFNSLADASELSIDLMKINHPLFYSKLSEAEKEAERKKIFLKCIYNTVDPLCYFNLIKEKQPSTAWGIMHSTGFCSSEIQIFFNDPIVKQFGLAIAHQGKKIAKYLSETQLGKLANENAAFLKAYQEQAYAFILPFFFSMDSSEQTSSPSSDPQTSERPLPPEPRNSLIKQVKDLIKNNTIEKWDHIPPLLSNQKTHLYPYYCPISKKPIRTIYIASYKGERILHPKGGYHYFEKQAIQEAINPSGITPPEGWPAGIPLELENIIPWKDGQLAINNMFERHLENASKLYNMTLQNILTT